MVLALQCFVIYQVLLFVFTRLNPIKFVKKFLPVMGFAFSTATSNATIPMSIDTLNKKMGVSKQISSFTIPLGATINMDGTSIMQGVAVIFIAEAYGIHLTPANLATVVVTATLASIGTAGIPSVGLVTLAMVLNSVGLPTEGIALHRQWVSTVFSICCVPPSTSQAMLSAQRLSAIRKRRSTARNIFQSQLNCNKLLAKSLFQTRSKAKKTRSRFRKPRGFRRERVFLILFFCYSSNAWRMLS